MISDPSDQQKSKLTSGKPSKLSFKISEPDLSLLTAIVHTPSGHTEECGLKKIPHGHVGKNNFLFFIIFIAVPSRLNLYQFSMYCNLNSKNLAALINNTNKLMLIIITKPFCLNLLFN